jgi:hypothetical protein
MKRILLFIFSFIQVVRIFAQEPDAELVYQKTDITIKNGILNKTMVFEIKINNRDGDRLAKISVPYSRLVKVSKIEAYLKDKNGTVIRKLDKSDIVDKSAISDYSFYEDNFIKEFTLKHNSYPYSVYYTYQIQQEEFIYIDYWLPVIERQTPTLKAVLNISSPIDYKISYSEQLTDTFKADTTGMQVNYTWTASYKDIIDNELFSPPAGNFMPHVIVVPQNFKYFAEGSFKSWLSFGDWQYELLQGISDLPQYELNTISKLVAGVNDKEEQIRILYHYLQDQTRYINITIETGGLKPYPASYVAENKYGDCKALTNYFRAVLDFIGIPSFYSIIKSGEPIVSTDRSFPSQQFNHVILNVPLQNDTIWLDCTSDGAFNVLGTFTQNRDVFVIDKSKSYFTRTPAMSRKEVHETRQVKIIEGPQKDAIAIFRNTYRGDKYETLFYVAHSMSESDKAKTIRNNFIEDGFDLTDFKLTEPGRDTSEIYLTYSASSDKIYNKYENEVVIAVIPFSLPDFEKPRNRKLPVQLDYPLYKTDTLEYEIPFLYSTPDSLPERSVINEFGEYRIGFFKNDDKILVIKSFLLNSGYYTKDKYEDFYAFISKVREIEKSSIIIAKNNN